MVLICSKLGIRARTHAYARQFFRTSDPAPHAFSVLCGIPKHGATKEAGAEITRLGCVKESGRAC